MAREMRTLIVGGALVAVAMSMTGCGPQPAGPTESASQTESPLSPAINWDTPPDPGTRTMTVAGLASVTDLAFDAVAPPFSGTLTRVEVSPAGEPPEGQYVVFRYELLSDGLVLVTESPTSETEQHLRDRAANPPGPADELSLVDLGGVTAQLNINAERSVGRVAFIKGGVIYDIAGPSLTPTSAVELATKLAAATG